MSLLDAPLRLLPLVAAGLCVAAVGAAQETKPGAKVVEHPADTVRYHRSPAIACHNCYEPELGPLTRALDSLGAVEIDIWRGERPGQWFVAHGNPLPSLLGSPKASESNCAEGDEKAGDLRRCLLLVADRLARRPDGEVLTVFLDVKDAFKRGWSPDVLDALVGSVVGARRLFTPGDLRKMTDSLGGSKEAPKWPPLGHLHGRVIVVLTGDEKDLSNYLDGGDTRVAFVARNAESREDVERLLAPSSGSPPLFVNVGIKLGNLGVGEVAARLGAVRRAASAARATRLWHVAHWGVLTKKAGADRRIRKEAACLHQRGELSFLAVYEDFAPIPPQRCPGR
jgi:hypothetical protein